VALPSTSTLKEAVLTWLLLLFPLLHFLLLYLDRTASNSNPQEFLETFTEGSSANLDADQWPFLNFIRTTAATFLLPGIDEYTKSWSRPFESIAKLATELQVEHLGAGLAESPSWVPTLFHRLLILLSVWPGPVTARQEVEVELETQMAFTKKALFDVLKRDAASPGDGKVLEEARLCLGDVWGLYEDQPRIAPPAY
jgi:hypothetical protein